MPWRGLAVMAGMYAVYHGPDGLRRPGMSVGGHGGCNGGFRDDGVVGRDEFRQGRAEFPGAAGGGGR